MDKRSREEGIEALVFPNAEYFESLGLKEGKKYDKPAVEERIHQIIASVNLSLLPYQRINRITILEEAMEMTTTRRSSGFLPDLFCVYIYRAP